MEMITIKDAAKNLGVESHVLRYWEEELGLEIKRNSMGHRYYDNRDIKMFKEVKDLRDRGFSLKDIKDGIEKQREKLKEEQIEDNTVNEVDKHLQGKDKQIEVDKYIKHKDMEKCVEKNESQISEKKNINQDNVDGFDQFKIVDFKTAQLQNIMNKIVANALKENKDIITTSIKSELTTDVMRQFDTVMREKEEKEEARYRKLDETIRLLQKSNEEVAATKIKRGLFKRSKRK